MPETGNVDVYKPEKKISKLSMIIGFGEECFKTTISEVG